MLFVFKPILVADAEIIFDYNFVAPLKSVFGRNKFDKRTAFNLQTSIWFHKKARHQTDKIIDQLHCLKNIPNVSFNFISCQEICK